MASNAKGNPGGGEALDGLEGGVYETMDSPSTDHNHPPNNDVDQTQKQVKSVQIEKQTEKTGSSSDLSLVTDIDDSDLDLVDCTTKLHFYGTPKVKFKDPLTKNKIKDIIAYVRNIKRKIAGFCIPERIESNKERSDVEKDLVELRKLIRYIQTTPESMGQDEQINHEDREILRTSIEDDSESLTIFAQSHIDNLRIKLSAYGEAIERLKRRSGKFNTRSSKDVIDENASIPAQYFLPTPQRKKRTRAVESEQSGNHFEENQPLLDWENPENFSESLSGSQSYEGDTAGEEDYEEDDPLKDVIQALLPLSDLQDIQSSLAMINQTYKLDLTVQDPDLLRRILYPNSYE